MTKPASTAALKSALKQMEVLKRAADACGSYEALGLAIGCSRGAPSMWLHRMRVPAEHAPAIERETKKRGKPVYCEELCPWVPWEVLREQAIPNEPKV